jgi:hypothetical protein
MRSTTASVPDHRSAASTKQESIVERFSLIMRRPIVLLAISALALGACSTAGPGSYSGAVVDGGLAVAVRGVAQESASIPAVSAEPGAATPVPSAFLPGITLTVEPSEGAVFGLPPTVPAGTNLLLFNVAEVAYQMTVLEKNPSVTDSWDAILACGVTTDVARIVGSVVAAPGTGSTGPITVANEGDDLLVLVPLEAPAESAAASEAPSLAVSEAPTAAASEAPSAAISEAPAASGGPSVAPSIAAEPAASPAPTCPPGGIAGATSEPGTSAAPSAIESASASPSESPSTKPQRTRKPGKTPKPRPTETPGPTPIAGIPDLTNAAWQVFTVTPPGTLPGQTAAP